MATTPEGKVKAKIRSLLDTYGQELYQHWPVPGGYGASTLDVLGCYRGRFFTIEAKAVGKKPTLRQTQDLQSIAQAMGQTFVIAGVDSPVFVDLRRWLEEIKWTVPYAPDIPQDATNRHVI